MTRTGQIAAAAALSFVLPSAILAQDVDIGKTLFDDYCAACHGVSAKGDGDMANIMTIPAPNLTLLAQANDGEYPMLRVIHVMDGRTGLRAHGGPMPVFGKVFQSSEPGPGNPYGPVLEARGRLMSVALYLESLQQ